ncbi:MAG: hypothetical protein UR12_C0011G0004 [candidate division TM6 bacterium GW2011_GWF2_30_66]|jgi:hypothetical protein|nr:MAG: hypothetical protein UR12_C0011G0004 [candidate division TM6 bacterium GW2011_GWF2_30_66]
MNRALKFLIALAMLTGVSVYANDCNSCNSCCDDCSYLGECDGYPYLQARSQGTNTARRIVGQQEFINKYGMDSAYGSFTIAAEYSQSFWNERLSHFLFGNDLVDCCNLLIQGSSVEGRNSKAWLADYFGLPTDYSSKVSFCPKIQNAIVDLDLFVGLDGWAKGLYMRFNAPIAWTKWQLCPSENTCDAGTGSFTQGYMSTSTITRDNLPTNFLQTMKGCTTFGDMKSPIKYSRFNSCDCTEAGLAEFDAELGWNFHLEEDHTFGLYLFASAPTGTRPNAVNIFEPIIGNGKHWELGGGLSGSWIFWRSEEHDSRYMGLWLDAMVATQFKAEQCRSFDFKCKPNSRYMLLEELTDATLLTGQPTEYTASTYQYAANLIPAVNWSTFQVDVSIPVYGDLSLKFGAVRENWSFDLGYNFWGRTGEKFCNDCCSSCSTDKVYAIKGSSVLYGRYSDTDDKSPQATDNHTVAIAQTQSTATIHGPALVNSIPQIDNPEDGYYTSNNLHKVIYSLVTTGTLQTSIQPVIVNKSMLNLGKSPSSITNKLFANISYAWKDRESNWIPFLGIGGEVEFSLDNYNDCCCCDNCNSCNSCTTSTTSTACNTSCGSCNDCGCNSPRGAVSIWGVWIKGGLSFD